MNKYVIAIVGFEDKNKAIAALKEVMKNEGIWLFTIAGSGVGAAKDVAEELGAPFQFVKSLKELEYQCNYIVADVSANQEVKNMIMRMKSAGKHGYVVR